MNARIELPPEAHSHAAAQVPRPRQVSIATDPVGLLTGTYTLSTAYVVSPRVAVRANIEAKDDMQYVTDSSSWLAGVSVPIYLDRALHGPFIEPGVVLAKRVMGIGSTVGTEEMPGTFYGVRDRTIGPQIFVGWQWMFRSGLHAAAAIGASRNWSTSGMGTSVPMPETYLRMGYAW